MADLHERQRSSLLSGSPLWSTADLRAIRGRICAIGPATRDALARLLIKVDVVAAEYIAEGLLDALSGYDLTGARILIARAAVARDVLPLALADRGAHVDVVEAYRTVAPPDLAGRAAEVLRGKPDWITFTSSSTVENLMAAVGGGGPAGNPNREYWTRHERCASKKQRRSQRRGIRLYSSRRDRRDISGEYNRIVKFPQPCAIVLLALAGCANKNVDSLEAVKQGVIRDISKNVNVGAMDVNVVSVSFRDKEADAVITFAPKGGPAAQGLTMNYTLERRGDEWHIKNRSSDAGPWRPGLRPEATCRAAI